MTPVDQEIAKLIATLHSAFPEARLWSGSAARACSAEIQRLVDELFQLRANLIELPWQG